MLQKDEIRVSVLRMVISAIGYYEIQKGGAGYEATEEDVLAVIQKEAKQHRDSIEQFVLGGRMDLAEKEKKELAYLETYLPEQMSDEEIKKLVTETIAQTGAQTPADMGKIMASLMPKIQGKADGTRVSKIVKEAFQKA